MMRSRDYRNQVGNNCSCARRNNTCDRWGDARRDDDNRTGCGRERAYACENDRRTAACNASARNSTSNPCESERLMALIRRLDFALVETNLYLDTHPHSHAALKYFERLLCERNQAADRYEAEFGPLTAMGNGDRNEWLWSTGAWPWQIDKESKR